MKKILILLLSLLLLTACKEKDADLMYNGTSENWSAQLTVSVINGSENYELKIEYKGNDLGSIETFNYYVENIDQGLNFGANNVSLNENGIYTNDDMSSNSPMTTDEDTFTITVDWNGESEDFVLN